MCDFQLAVIMASLYHIYPPVLRIYSVALNFRKLLECAESLERGWSRPSLRQAAQAIAAEDPCSFLLEPPPIAPNSSHADPLRATNSH